VPCLLPQPNAQSIANMKLLGLNAIVIKLQLAVGQHAVNVRKHDRNFGTSFANVTHEKAIEVIGSLVRFGLLGMSLFV